MGHGGGSVEARASSHDSGSAAREKFKIQKVMHPLCKTRNISHECVGHSPNKTWSGGGGISL
jgi:hypothetical protein